MLLFTWEDCIEPSRYVTREEDTVYAPMTAYLISKHLFFRRQDPKMARNISMIAASTTSPSIRTNVPLGLFQKSLVRLDNKANNVALMPPISSSDLNAMQ
jgi:hypothetical protein